MASPESSRLVVSQLILPETISLRLTARDRDGVLEELVGRIPEIAGRPDARQTLLRALVEREQLHSTGVGDGIALPHTRNALAGIVERPVVVFGRHAAGLAFGALDGKPTHLFFLLVTTSVTQHLQLLARISRLIRDARLRQGLMNAERPEQVIQSLAETESRM